MRLLEYFHDYPTQANPNPFRPKSTWTPPPDREITLNTFLDAVEHDARNIKTEPVLTTWPYATSCLQPHGTAMGTRMAPSYANLFLTKFETDTLSRAPFQPFIWLRYIDDIFMIWTRSVLDLNTFTSFLNDIHTTIKFTCDYSFTSITFLDVNVSIHNGKIVTDLYTKPTNEHQYLLHSSCHPIHTKCAIPNFSLALRLRRICSTNETFTLRTNELTDYLYKRGCNHYFLQREIQWVNYLLFNN